MTGSCCTAWRSGGGALRLHVQQLQSLSTGGGDDCRGSGRRCRSRRGHVLSRVACLPAPPKKRGRSISGCDRADPTQKSRRNAPWVPSGVTLAKRDASMLRPVREGLDAKTGLGACMAHATVDRRRRASTGRRLRHVAVGRGRANTQVDAQDQSGRQCGGSLGLMARLRAAWRGSRQAQGSISTACTSPFDQTCSILIKTVLPSISNGTSRRSAAGSLPRSSRVTHFFVPSFILTWNLYSTRSPFRNRGAAANYRLPDRRPP